MNMLHLLEDIADVFGEARLIGQVRGLRTRRLSHRIEIRGHRDANWRPLLDVAFIHNNPLPTAHIDALPEDLERAQRFIT